MFSHFSLFWNFQAHDAAPVYKILHICGGEGEWGILMGVGVNPHAMAPNTRSKYK